MTAELISNKTAGELILLAARGGSKRGHAPQSEVCFPPHCPPPNKIFGKCNWTPGMKI